MILREDCAGRGDRGGFRGRRPARGARARVDLRVRAAPPGAPAAIPGSGRDPRRERGIRTGPGVPAV